MLENLGSGTKKSAETHNILGLCKSSFHYRFIKCNHIVMVGPNAIQLV